MIYLKKCFFLFTVLNFFPVPVDDECLSDDGRRSGVCLNVYECRIQGGTSKGECALGFGVCCVCKFKNIMNFFFIIIMTTTVYTPRYKKTTF